MQSPFLLKSTDSSNDSIKGWLPVLNEIEDSIVKYLDSIGIQQLILIEYIQQRNSVGSLDIGTPQSCRQLSLDSSLLQRRNFRLSSSQQI